jgi:hypothetical protein
VFQQHNRGIVLSGKGQQQRAFASGGFPVVVLRCLYDRGDQYAFPRFLDDVAGLTDDHDIRNGLVRTCR